MSVSTTIKRIGLEKAFDYLYKDPEKNMITIMDWADRIANGDWASQRRVIRAAVENKDHAYNYFIHHLIDEVDHDLLTTNAVNFFINANLLGWKKQEEVRNKYNCNVPWAMIMDPTSACNLHCTGCWAAEYGNKYNLSYDDMDSIITQGKEMGVYFYMYTGGEPLVRKNDLIKLAEKHDDCAFLCFTNGTLIDDGFAKEMLRIKNFIPAISLEGFREATDERRGEGTFDKVVEAMKIMRRHKLLYGISSCYTSANYKSIISEEFYDFLVEQGADFIWLFHYMPVGNDADLDLLLTPEQREELFHRTRELRWTKPMFTMDFQNDGQFVNGCIAGGKRYLHINANGDIEPCVFVHYSDTNIHEKSILDALRSPLLMKYHDGQPFNDNMLMPCPMLENPDRLVEMIRDTDAVSTDMASPETIEHLCGKCERYAEHWKPKAEELWEIEKEKIAKKHEEAL